MRIGICDDEDMMRQEIRKICNQSLMEYDLNCEFVEFQDGMEVLRFAERLEILLLDIEMPGIDGIEVKNRYGFMDSNVLIIFVTRHRERMREAFGHNVVAFVEKKYMKRDLPVKLASALRKVARFVILDGGIDSRDVVYIHTERIYCKVLLADGCERILRIPMRELESELADVGFVRVHRSYLVNMQYVDEVDDSVVYILSQKIPVSARNRTKVKKAYENSRG